MKKIVLCVMVILLALVLAGCFPGSEQFKTQPAGFFTGIWHGWIAPISLIMGLINGGKTRIYETFNTGILYDLGYYVAVISGFGGLALRRRKKK